jgi:rhamnosyltransferase
VTVAFPVRNGGELFPRALAAVRRQILDADVELLIVDSGSTDGSLERAREYEARVIEIAPADFGHGTTRNMLIEEARGSHVALLTADAEPADDFWLERLLGAFDQADDVGLAYGPYIARPDASAAVRLELERWFSSIPAGIERLAPQERDVSPTELMGRRGFFTDVNACVSRQAWEHVPYRDVSYAEDRALALDMLRAGYAKVFEPRAAVLHSHDYGPRELFGRAFDESRGVREVYGWREPATPRYVFSQVRGEVGALHRGGATTTSLVKAARDKLIALAGAAVGSRADHLPPLAQRLLSRERRVVPGGTHEAARR